MADFETEQTDELICPHCGAEQVDSWELLEFPGNTSCLSCGKNFGFEVEASYTWTSFPMVVMEK